MDSNAALPGGLCLARVVVSGAIGDGSRAHACACGFDLPEAEEIERGRMSSARMSDRAKP